MTNNDEIPVSVLIVGAGPVGLALAIELGLRDIDCILIERRDGKLSVPRMSQVSGRNMEFCRRWGIADQVRNAVWSSSHPLDFVYTTSLIGEEIMRVKVPSYQTRGNLDYSPEGTCTCPQIYFDPILAEKTRSLPRVTMRYNTQLESFEQDDDGVRALVTDRATGRQETIEARYMIGCDGGNSLVREALDIPLDGLGSIATSVNIFFRSPELASLHDKGWARFFRMLDETGCWSELIAIDGNEYWRLTVFHDDEPDLEGHSYLRRAVGRDFEYEIIDVSAWDRRDYVARTYRKDRVMIAGDSAHQCSPTGGLGMHTGICEAVNMAWKFEAIFKGWGGPGLIPSVETECRPIAREYVDLSTASYNALAALPGASDLPTAIEGDANLLRSLSIPDQLRSHICYEGSPICLADGTPAPEGAERLKPSARPGTRIPHVWIEDGKSTLDLFGDGFILLRLGAADIDIGALQTAAGDRSVPFSVVDLDNDEVARLCERKLVLVRPDGHVAWRGNALPSDCGSLIDQVRGA
jgi:2-polyprenyl-6-methoxyphenol hydroxylase-like FAD-dependent oxidoreductase